MKKRTLAAVMTAVIVLAMTGCGNTGAKTESAAAATTQEAAEEVAEKEEWMNDPTAYLSGITASDYVDLPADYASMTVEVEPVTEVTDEEVEAMIDQQRQAKRELQEVTKRNKVQEGDVVNIDYVGRIDGEEFDGGSAEDYNLEIGSGSFIDGFEDGLIGQKVGETVTLELTFPENYADSTKAGVDAEFDVTINSIQQYEVPKLTDQFVAELGITDDFGNTVNTVDGLRTYVRNYLVENYESQYTQRLEEAIRNSLYEKSTFKKDIPEAMIERMNESIASDIPEAMIERMNESIASELTAYAQQYGVDLKTLMQLAYGSTEDSYEQDIKDMASESIKKNIILKAIGDKEGLSMSDDDFQAELEVAISNSGYTSGDDVPREDQESYREILDRRKVMDFLKSKTTVNAPAAEEGSTGATAAAAETETVK